MSHFLRIARNTAGRDLIVGDVHGCFTKLAKQLAQIGFDHTKDRLFSVGDLVDRGPESHAVSGWLDQPWFFAVTGNHEQMAMDYHADAIDTGLYAMNGGSWFIGMMEQERQPIVDRLRGLPLAIELETEAGTVGLVHADCPRHAWSDFVATVDNPNVQATAIWNRSRYDAGDCRPVSGIRAVVVGHTPVVEGDQPRVLGNHIYIDSGAWLPRLADRPFFILDAATLQVVTPH